MNLKEVNAENFYSEIQEGIVLVDFWASWCGPCRMIAPEIEALAKENQDIKILKVDIDNEEELASKYDIMSIPTVIIFKDGEMKDTISGVRKKAFFEDKISALR
ncbi:MAG: thioredoxin [Candidatus Cloacimonadota bacterium]|nr:MAG: thioredoxin [Candidatus Cloacimonadota bacterium]